jgi:hypothetical protein
MTVDAPQQPLEDANRLIGASAQGLNADCVFQGWTRDRQMAAYRELNKIQNPNDSIPDLTLAMDGNGMHLVKRGQTEPSKDYCQTAVKPETTRHLPQVEFEGDETWKAFRKIEKETRADRATTEAERVKHPEIPAQKVEDLGTKALNGDEQAKLDLRKELEKVMNDPNQAFRDQVLKKLAEDGAKLGGDSPYIVINKDEQGNPTTIEFKSTRFGVTKETVHLNETLEEQAARANRDFIEALQSYPGGIGKFNPTQGMRCIEILEGADPKVPSWFMIYRQQQGLPMLDRSVARTKPE